MPLPTGDQSSCAVPVPPDAIAVMVTSAPLHNGVLPCTSSTNGVGSVSVMLSVLSQPLASATTTV